MTVNSHKQEIFLVDTALSELNSKHRIDAEHWRVSGNTWFSSLWQQSPVSQELPPRGTGEVQQHHQYPVHCHPQKGKKINQLADGESIKFKHLHTKQNCYICL